MESLCGYRVIRQLGGGVRSQVMLAHDSLDRTVVLRLLKADVPESAVSAMIAAATAVDDDHVLPLVDVAALDDGRVLLVTPWLAGGTLGELIASRGGLPDHQAAGVVVAVARGVRALHDAGWSHGRIDPTSVLLSSDGFAVLAGLGDASPLDEETSRADHAALCALTVRLFAGVGAASALLDQIGQGTLTAADIEWAVVGAFEPQTVSAQPEPPRARGGDRASARVSFDDLFAVTTVERRSGGALPSWVTAVLGHEGIGRVSAHRLRDAVRSVRPRVWAIAGVSALALIVATAVIPDKAGDVRAAEVAPSSADPSPQQTSLGTTTSDDAGSVVEVDASQLASDDPLVAARALIDLRDSCFEARSADCLASVDQPASAALAADLASLDRLESGAVAPERLPDPGESPFVQRTGDSAIVAGESASLLLIRGESGWKIRDVFDSPGGESNTSQ